ncbi:MAG TPA: hypothetical protein VFZ65_22505 [Planctomycetota bacterium]|nr:hypothetical protein [Planctomycetota bacterium]
MLRRLLALSLLTATSLAQVSQGPFIGCPVHCGVDHDTYSSLGGPGGTLMDPNTLYLKRAGIDSDVVAGPAFGPNRPRFTFDAMFGPGRPPGFRLDGFSSGYHTVFCTYSMSGQPILDVPAGSWGALLFSVTRNTMGGDSAAVMAESMASDGPGADVFSLVLPGSTLPPSLVPCVAVGEATRATDSTEMGFDPTTMRPEMTDFDPFFTFYETTGPLPSFLQTEPWVYFSLPNAVAMDPAVASWFTMRGGAALPWPHDQPSGATILRTQWVTTPMGHWTQPEVFLSFVDLGFASMPGMTPDPSHDIDALAVDEGHSLVLLSMKRNMTPNLLGEQLMVARWTYSGGTPVGDLPARPYLYWDPTDGTPVLQPVGKIAGAGGGGEIDATCELDPSNANGAAGFVFPYLVLCRDAPLPTTMSASASILTSSATTTIVVSASGLQNTSGLCIWALFWGLPGPFATPFVDIINGTFGLYAGSTQSFALTAGTSVLSGYSLDFQWLTLDGPAWSLSSVVRCQF